jgi:hypothetical protein
VIRRLPPPSHPTRADHDKTVASQIPRPSACETRGTSRNAGAFLSIIPLYKKYFLINVLGKRPIRRLKNDTSLLKYRNNSNAL